MRVDVHKVFVDDAHYNAGHGHAYEGYGVGRDGAVVVVRPDQCEFPRASLLISRC
jgi:phenol 2-monooxygenase